MGNSSTCTGTCSGEQRDAINYDDYVESPSISREDVRFIHNCFEYLEPENGLVNVEKIRRRPDIEYL